LKYQWINPKEAETIRNQKVVLFGAGHGSEEYIYFCQKMKLGNQILYVVDNDTSYCGKRFKGYEIKPPNCILESNMDCIIITSVSGREAIARQLENMGFKSDIDFVLVGRFPKTYQRHFDMMFNDVRFIFPLEEKDVLHVGPGGFLGLEVLLYCCGVKRICSIDKNTFGIRYPDITEHYEEYQNIQNILETLSCEKKMKERAISRFASLFQTKDNRFLMDSSKINYHYPMDVCALEFEDDTFDAVLSFAVLEHVEEPSSAVGEMTRVLKKGGVILSSVVTRDHRSFSEVNGYTPFSFRSLSTDQWEEVCSNKFYQNRLMPIEWKKLFEENNLSLMRYSIGNTVEIDDYMMETFHPDFKRFSKKTLGEIDCMILAKK
jgi:SAM-dependent methyltransferase